MPPLPKDPDSEMDCYDQNVKRPALERKRELLSDRLPSLTGEEKAAVEKELAAVEVALKSLSIGR